MKTATILKNSTAFSTADIVTMFTLVSSNQKTGEIPVTTTSSNTCPKACPFLRYRAGEVDPHCYGADGRLGMLWRNMSKAIPGEKFKSGCCDIQSYTWEGLCDRIRALPMWQLWRHNQAGDLPGDDDDNLNPDAVEMLTDANRGKRGFTFCHYPPTPHNVAVLRKANADGFTVNLSANSPAHMDSMIHLGLPLVTLLPADTTASITVSPAGHKIKTCPATIRDDITCKDCGFCQKRDRKTPVGFPGHGSRSKGIADMLAQSDIEYPIGDAGFRLADMLAA